MQGRSLRNKKASYRYQILDTVEAGIVLKGTEVKSLRAGNVNIVDSFAKIEDGEVFLCNMHIAPYEEGNIFNPSPYRKRKLLIAGKAIFFYNNVLTAYHSIGISWSFPALP